MIEKMVKSSFACHTEIHVQQHSSAAHYFVCWCSQVHGIATKNCTVRIYANNATAQC